MPFSQADAAGRAGHEGNGALSRQRPQVIVGRIGGAKSKPLGNLGPGRRHPSAVEAFANQIQYLGLPQRQLMHE
jgi:hypothetical protein